MTEPVPDPLPAPLVHPPEPVPVQVLHEGQWRPGMVRAWRGDRVYAQFSTAPGMSHLVWVPAEQVRRMGA